MSMRVAAGRFRKAHSEYRRGRGFGYPACCCAQYALAYLFWRYPHHFLRRGSVRRGARIYVPCRLCQVTDPAAASALQRKRERLEPHGIRVELRLSDIRRNTQ